jgi:hypothetical protein
VLAVRIRTFLWVAAVALASTTALAAGPSAADRETARRLMQEGEALEAKRDLAGAERRYATAHALMQVPTTGLALAKAQLAQGRLLDARDTLVSTLLIPPAPHEAAPLASARAEARVLCDDVGARIPTVTVAVKGRGRDEPIVFSIDGETVPDAMLGQPRAVDPGTHRFVVRAGGREAKAEVAVVERDSRIVELRLPSSASAEAPASTAPRAATPPGELTAVSGESAAPAAAVEPPAPMWPIYAGLGGVGLAVATGTVTGLFALSKSSTLQNECPGKVCPTSARGDYDAARTARATSDIAFATAAVGAAIVAIVWITRGSNAARTAAWNHPLNLAGTF